MNKGELSQAMLRLKHSNRLNVEPINLTVMLWSRYLILVRSDKEGMLLFIQSIVKCVVL